MTTDIQARIRTKAVGRGFLGCCFLWKLEEEKKKWVCAVDMKTGEKEWIYEFTGKNGDEGDDTFLRWIWSWNSENTESKMYGRNKLIFLF